jgi:hypothetical protein
LKNDLLDLVPVEFVIDRSSSILRDGVPSGARAEANLKHGRALASNNKEP